MIDGCTFPFTAQIVGISAESRIMIDGIERNQHGTALRNSLKISNKYKILIFELMLTIRHLSSIKLI